VGATLFGSRSQVFKDEPGRLRPLSARNACDVTAALTRRAILAIDRRGDRLKGAVGFDAG
jgi:hypothetical protein